MGIISGLIKVYGLIGIVVFLAVASLFIHHTYSQEAEQKERRNKVVTKNAYNFDRFIQKSISKCGYVKKTNPLGRIDRNACRCMVNKQLNHVPLAKKKTVMSHLKSSPVDGSILSSVTKEQRVDMFFSGYSSYRFLKLKRKLLQSNKLSSTNALTENDFQKFELATFWDAVEGCIPKAEYSNYDKYKDANSGIRIMKRALMDVRQTKARRDELITKGKIVVK